MIHVMPERWKPSVTVAAIIERITDGERRFLLVEEHTPEGLKLNNPAGHLDPEESPQQGVGREVLEETTCVFTPDRLVGVYLSRFQRPATGEDITFLRFAFGGTVGEPDAARGLDEPDEKMLAGYTRRAERLLLDAENEVGALLSANVPALLLLAARLEQDGNLDDQTVKSIVAGATS